MSMVNEQKERFYEECEEEFGFTREEIIAILSEIGQWFIVSEIPIYRTVIKKRYDKRLRDEEKAKALNRPVTAISCPICGADTSGDVKLYGKYSHTEGWVCMKGGVKHFYWWKTNKIREQMGLPPIDFESIDWDDVKLDSERLNE